jgi:hypothetical protein
VYVLQLKEGSLPTIQGTVGVCKITLHIILRVLLVGSPYVIAFHRDVYSILPVPVK